MATAEFFKFAGILSAALSQHHLLGFEIAQLEFPSPPLALFVMMLSKAHLTSHSRMSGSRSDGKESAYNTGDLGSVPRLGRSPGEGSSNSLQCSCLENSMDSGAWWATVQGVAKSRI